VVEYDNENGEFSLTDAREEVNESFSNIFHGNIDWQVLCVARDVDDAYDIINNAIDLDEMLLGDQN
jgi:hypothetical protein